VDSVELHISQSALWWTVSVAAALLALFALVVWMKGRPFAAGEVFRAS